jgi:RNA polymerase sigma factor (sigma-70 family)
MKLMSRAANDKPLESEDLSVLARRAATGEVVATTQLLRKLAPEMLRVVRGVLGSQLADVEDAMQQALVGLVHALPAFRGECSPAGYACRIAFRTALAQRRQGIKQRKRADLSADTDVWSGDRGREPPSEARSRMELLRRLLENLPTEQSEALCLRTVLGWSLPEIAEASGVPLNTVRSRLRLAKEALRDRIEADPGLAEALGVRP